MKRSKILYYIFWFTFLIISLIFLHKEYYKEVNTVEQYCAIAYSHSVTDYKACTKLSEEKLIKKLTSDFNKNNKAPILEIIK